MADEAPRTQQNRVGRKQLKRGPMTAVACEACQKRKTKCDGERPACSTCRVANLSECLYEVGSDGSRIQQLRKRNQDLKNEVAVLLSRLCDSWAERDPSEQRQRKRGWDPDLSPLSEQNVNPTALARVNPETQAQETADEDEGASDRVTDTLRLSNITPQLTIDKILGSQHGSKDRPQGSVSGDQLTNMLGSLPFGASLDQIQQTGNLSIPIHLIQPAEQYHDSPVSNVYTSFRNFARQAIASGEPDSRILGSFEINAGVIFSNGNFRNASFLSQWAEQVVSAWGLQSLGPKIGMMYMLFMLMRWQVLSSPTTFDDIPEIMRPTSTQICVPHPPFIDFIVWPVIRDLFISEPSMYESLGWVEKIAESIDLAKSFAFDEMLYVEPSTGQFRLQETFRLYIENADHWTLPQEVANLIPQLSTKVHFRER